MLVAAGAPAGVFVVPVGALAIGVILLAWLPRLAYRCWAYTVDDRALVLRHGVVFRSESAIPYFRVQHVDIERGPLERAWGLSRLVVRTASATTDATIPGLSEHDAGELRRLILERAGRGDAV